LIHVSYISQSKKFFDLPLETKNLAPHPPGGSHHRGYSGLGLEKSFKISRNGVDAEAIEALKDAPDVKESFESGNVNDETQPNIWLPEDKLPGFRAYGSPYCGIIIFLTFQILDSWSPSSPTSPR
jgi:isopenicillin N synthase-like dioxygenase